MFSYQITPVFGKGLGLGYTSLSQQGTVLPVKPIGTAKVAVFANLGNGNLIVRDHVISIEESIGQLDLYMTYNSMAASPAESWHFSQDKRITKFPTKASPTIELIEGDGHQTTYTQMSGDNALFYAAPAHANGTPFFTLDEVRNQWVWFDRATRTREVYDLNGKLIKRLNAKGDELDFIYDSKGRLLQLHCLNSGNVYQLTRSDDTIQIILNPDSNSKLLCTYIFDDQKRLQKTMLADNYHIDYDYRNTVALNTIKQTDQVDCNFIYIDPTRGTLNTISVGPELYQLAYQGSPDPHKLLKHADIIKGINAAMQDPTGITIKFAVDPKTLAITKRLLPAGFGPASQVIDETDYAYTNGQLTQITYPDGGCQKNIFDSVTGLIYQSITPEGYVTEHYYSLVSNNCSPETINRYHIKNPENKAVTRFVYDYVYTNNYYGHFLPRFKISPEGRVTEYVYSKNLFNVIAYEKHYLANQLNVSHMPVNETHTVGYMEEWVKEVNKHDPKQIQLTMLYHNNRQQIIERNQYANINAQGEGIADAEMGNLIQHWNMHGDLLFVSQRQKYIDAEHSITSQTSNVLDGLRRLTSHTDPMGEITRNQYIIDTKSQTNQVQVTLPNGQLQLATYALPHYLTQQNRTAETPQGKEQRVQDFYCDRYGRPIVIKHPDGRLTVKFWDRQQQLGYIVSATGLVTCYSYDHKHNSHTKREYATAIDIKKLFLIPPGPGMVPSVSMLQALLKESADDRVSHTINDTDDRPRFIIDADNYLTEYRYDFNDTQKSVIIKYAEALSDDQVQQLLNGDALKLTIDPNRDRIQHYFYDHDRLLIGKQDPTGYVTLYERNGAGWKTDEYRFATPTAVNWQTQNVKDVSPEKDPKHDANTHFDYDARGQVIRIIDPEGYVTKKTWLAGGLVESIRRYANKLKDNEFYPEESPEDQVTSYDYDKADRVVKAHKPFARDDFTVFDNMGDITSSGSIDAKQPDALEPDCQRHTETRYDGWRQKIKYANPFIANEINLIEANKNLTPAEKKALIEHLWQDVSIRYCFDDTGLLLSKTDSVGLITYYFYDQERRPIVTINSLGIIKEKTYNNFNEVKQTRHYANKFPSDDIANLKGGFISKALRQQLDQLQDPEHDAVISFKRNKRGLITQITDARGYITKKHWNAFAQCDIEQLPVASKQPTLNIHHEFEPRGLETKTTKQSDELSVTIRREYKNLYGKQTKFIDANKGEHDTVTIVKVWFMHYKMP